MKYKKNNDKNGQKWKSDLSVTLTRPFKRCTNKAARLCAVSKMDLRWSGGVGM